MYIFYKEARLVEPIVVEPQFNLVLSVL